MILRSFSLLALLFVSLGSVSGQDDTRIVKNFDPAKAASLRIVNSFGKVQVQQHQKPDIEVVISIVMDVKNQSRRKELLSRISIDTEEKVNTVVLTTRNNLKGDKDVKNFEINYSIRLPADVNLEITNQFGDVVMADYDGRLTLKVQHGSAFLQRLSHTDNELKVQFGNLQCAKLRNSKVEVQHGDCTLEDAHGINLSLQFGKGEIDRMSGANVLKVQHSKLNVANVHPSTESINLDASFSTLSIGGLLQLNLASQLDGMFTSFSWSGDVPTYTEDRGYNKEFHILNRSKASGGKPQVVIVGKHSKVKLN